jgi:glycine cleavage system H lipoate-binding protein
VNADPHGSWLMVIRIANPAELSTLLDASQYADLVK